MSSMRSSTVCATTSAISTKSKRARGSLYSAWGWRFSPLFFQAEDGIRDVAVTGVQTCALPISGHIPDTYVRPEFGGLPCRFHDVDGMEQLRESAGGVDRGNPECAAVVQRNGDRRCCRDRKSVV